MTTDTTLTIPESCLEQIRLQRTQCRAASDPREAWAASIFRDWAEIAPYVPTDCRRAVDIGCGLGGVDVLLYRHCKCTLYMCDRDAMESNPRYGYSAEPSAYCLHDQVSAFLRANGVPSGDVCLSTTLPNPGLRVDLVLSLISWGFHYPLSTYLDAVAAMLRPGGRLILDLRADGDGNARDKATLRDAIGDILYVSEAGKQCRIIAERRNDGGQAPC